MTTPAEHPANRGSSARDAAPARTALPQSGPLEVPVTFYSYFKEMTGCAEASETVAPEATLGELHQQLMRRFPKLAPMENSTLMAVGVEYQPREYRLRPGDEVALFPPVQGG